VRPAVDSTLSDYRSTENAHTPADMYDFHG
jgi:hypothetical protein